MSHTNKDLDDFFSEQRVGNMPDVMIDLETMGTRPNAPMMAIGAVAFNLATCEIGDVFYRNIDLESSVANGATIDPSTAMWWLQQSDDARRAITSGERLKVNDFLPQFAEWLRVSCVAQRDRKVWATGTDFDVVILSEHYKRAGLEPPWSFWNSRDQRTVRELFKSKVDGMQRKGSKHNALDDAVFQVEQLFAIRKAK